MKKILLILLIGIIAFTSCDSPKSNGEKLGNKLCECLTATQNEANCKAEIDKLTSDYKEKYKNSPSDLMQFISGYTSVSLNCLGKIGEQSLNKLSKISYTGGNENIQTEDYDKAVEALSKISESSKPSSSFSLQGITVKYIFFCVLLILCGVLMNMYGERKFGLSLSLSFMIIWMCLFSMINFIGATTAVIIITFSVMIYIFYKPFMYFFTWFYLAVLIAMILYLPITLFAATKTYPTFISYIALAASAIFIYFKRYHLKRITITFIGGISLGLGLAGIVSYQQFSSGNYWNALTLPFTIIALCVLGSLIYQYKDKLFKSKNVTELTNDITSDDTNNVNNNTINCQVSQGC